MNLYRHAEEVKLELQIAPLIDVVFLLLIYFMVTPALIRKEGDISFMLPANVAAEDMVDIPVEVLIEITADGTVQVEGMRFSRDDRNLEDLAMQIRGLRAIAAAQRSPFFVNVMPHKDALHRRIIDVMDACAAAGVNSLTFSKSM
ncbi:MAG: biopolymer transporter ExbD [Kiritimatiellales bacterium]|nr:biopolymer transporter ExbD [Kiritimatiellales bacterium]